MASIRRLKKDINYLADEIVRESLFVNLLFKGSEDKIKGIIEEALNNRKELMKRTCDKKQPKANYKVIRKDMITMADNSFKNLAELTK